MKLFNKQRMSFLKNQQFKKYIIYAIGEIILVIIGILIALGISNWNKKQELKTANKELQHKVFSQLEKDIVFIEDFQKEIDTLNQSYLKILDRDYDKSKVNDGALISTILFDVITLSLDNQVNNLLDNAALDNSDASQELINLNSAYKLHFKNIDDIEALIFEQMTNNLTELEKTQPWYVDLITDFVCRNDCINYLLHDKEHKSRIASSRFLIVNGYGGAVLSDFYEDLVSHREKLKSLLSN